MLQVINLERGMTENKSPFFDPHLGDLPSYRFFSELFALELDYNIPLFAGILGRELLNKRPISLFENFNDISFSGEVVEFILGEGGFTDLFPIEENLCARRRRIEVEIDYIF